MNSQLNNKNFKLYKRDYVSIHSIKVTPKLFSIKTMNLLLNISQLKNFIN